MTIHQKVKRVLLLNVRVCNHNKHINHYTEYNSPKKCARHVELQARAETEIYDIIKTMTEDEYNSTDLETVLCMDYETAIN